MPLPTKADLDKKYGPGNAPTMTQADVDRFNAEKEEFWAELHAKDAEDEKAKQAEMRKQNEDNFSSNYPMGDDDALQPIADTDRPAQAITNGSLKSAKKGKRDTGISGDQSSKIKSTETTASPTFDSPGAFTPASYAPAKKGPCKNDATYASRTVVDIRRLASQAWYRDVNSRAKFGRGDLSTLSYLVDTVKRYVKAAKDRDGYARARQEQALRTSLAKMPFHKFLSPILIKKSRVMEEPGLPAIFQNEEGVEFPYDLKADALALWNRWMEGDIDGYLLRGLIIEKAVLENGKKRTAYRLDPDYKFKKSANAIGSNNLVNGQWRPNRLCLLRDGAHGEVEAGISGQTGQGAHSIVMSAGGYADDDQGEVIRYCGTESDNPTPTKNTQLMLDAETKNNEIRLFRSDKKGVNFAPTKGIRYDGLYRIKGHEILNKATGMYRFRLERLPGQDPIRYQGVEKRPNESELIEVANNRDALSYLI